MLLKLKVVFILDFKAISSNFCGHRKPDFNSVKTNRVIRAEKSLGMIFDLKFITRLCSLYVMNWLLYVETFDIS